MVEKLKQWFWSLFSSGLPRDHDLEILRKVFLSNLIIFFGSIFLSILGILALIQDYIIVAVIDFAVWLFLIGLFVFLRRKKRYNIAAFLGSAVIGLFYFYLITSGGVNATGFVWLFSYPLISLFMLGSKRGSFLALLLLFMTSLSFVVAPLIPGLAVYPPDLMIRFIPAYIVIYAFALVMEILREVVQKRLNSSNQALTATVTALKSANIEKEELIDRLQRSIQEIEMLQDIIPICANCKKIRNDSGYWEQVEHYFHNRSNTRFSHGICPDCEAKLYGELDPED
ncbi:MAG: hypothetical protein U5R06_07520 [candidate division KSB1 bacterium]|nr:hypothetical protein [candidate division KSB1 bacterium]